MSELRNDFIAAMRLVPGPIAIIAVAHDGLRGGLAATAWTSLSADPPTLLACVNKTVSAHGDILAARRFSISLVDQAHRETVAIFSRQRGLMGNDRFLDGAWDEGPLGQPLLRGAVAAFECRLDRVEDGGTHSILIGSVAHVASAATGAPLLYRDGTFGIVAPHSKPA